jgi:DNA (cytosine-5)-methyltransferase 1
VLNFSDEGESIFDRKKPLVDATLERIYAGLIKFVAGGKREFLLKYNSMSQKHKYVAPGVDQPCPTVSTQGRLNLCNVRFLTKAYSGRPEGKVQSVNKPSGSITTVDHHQLINTQFISAYYGNGDNVSSVDNPSPTVTTKDRLSLVQTRFIDQQFGQSNPASIEKPLGCITVNPKYAPVTVRRFITPVWLMNTNFRNVGSSVEKPSQVITANRKWHYLLNPQFASAGGSVDKPCFTLIARMDKMPPYLIDAATNTSCVPSFIKAVDGGFVFEIYDTDSEPMVRIKEFMAIYGILDILMRMLRIPELKKIMGFPEDYILIGTQADQKKFLGNAVEVHMATAIVEATAKAHYLKQLAV